jgi:hypothetical protein
MNGRQIVIWKNEALVKKQIYYDPYVIDQDVSAPLEYEPYEEIVSPITFLKLSTGYGTEQPDCFYHDTPQQLHEEKC